MHRFEIRVTGHLGRRAARALGCDELQLEPGGHSVLLFTAVDQAALYGLLSRLRDRGLELISVERLAPPTVERGGQGRADASAREGTDASD